MYYLLVLLSSVPLFLWLFKIQNLNKSPISYFYFFGSFLFIILGSGYSLDGDNIYFRGNIETLNFVIILSLLSLSILTTRYFIINDRKTLDLISNITSDKVSIFFYLLAIIHFVYIINFLVNHNILNYLLIASSGSGARSIMSQRAEVFSGGGGFTTFFFYYVTYFLTSVTIVIVKNSFIRYLLLAFYFFCVISLLHKTPVVMFSLTIFLTRVLIGRPLNYRKLFKLSCVLLTLIFVFYIFYFPGREVSFYIYELPLSIFHRIGGVYSEAVAYSIYRTELLNHELYLGSTFPNPGGIFPFNPIYLPSIMHLEFMKFPGNLSTPAVGEIYANFGFTFTCIYIMLMPIFIALIERQLLQSQIEGVIKVALVVYLSLLVFLLAQTSLFSSVFELKHIAFILLVSIIFKFRIGYEKNINVN